MRKRGKCFNQEKEKEKMRKIKKKRGNRKNEIRMAKTQEKKNMGPAVRSSVSAS